MKNRKGVFVVPVFVGEEKIEGQESKFTRVSATQASTGFPDVPHARCENANNVLQQLG